MKLMTLTFGLFIVLAMSCGSDAEKAPASNAAKQEISATEKQEVIKLDSLSEQLDKASSEIDKKVSELDAALEEL